MKTIKIMVMALVLGLCLAVSANAKGIFNIVLDASGSVSQSDFELENAAAAALITVLNAANEAKSGYTSGADLVAVSWFGGDDDYAQTPYLNLASTIQTAAALEILSEVQHPEFGNTAVYTALLKATLASIEQEESTGRNYDNVVIIVTDGKDNNSSYEAKQLAKKLFPNNEIFVAVIGVGSNADISEFEPYADDLRHIGDFAELAATLAIYAAVSN